LQDCAILTPNAIQLIHPIIRKRSPSSNYRVTLLPSALTYSALLLFFLIIVGCNREISCENCLEPPVAIAGEDRVIVFPKDTIVVDGTASYSSYGKIVSWQWSVIRTAASASIPGYDKAIAEVQQLSIGETEIVLTVTNTAGLSSSDTLAVKVLDPSLTGHPPIADAGLDQQVYSPITFTYADGSNSTDPDNDIVSYEWKFLSGPTNPVIETPKAVNTRIRALQNGDYLFTLKVTDATGLQDTDTLLINATTQYVRMECDNSAGRQLVNAALWSVGKLSETRNGISTVVHGNKIYFAGGTNTAQLASKTVDIFDVDTKQISTASLSIGRHSISAISTPDRILFAGGNIGSGSNPVANVDILNTTTNAWTATQLSVPGQGMAAGLLGNKVFFAGGDQGVNGNAADTRSRQVDIYDLNANVWSAAKLKDIRKYGLGAAVVGSKIYFAGGFTKFNNDYSSGSEGASETIDVFDNATSQWSVMSLGEGKFYLACNVVGDKIYWAGGRTGFTQPSGIINSCSVEIFDTKNNKRSFENLAGPGLWDHGINRNGVVCKNKIVYIKQHTAGVATDKFDIYETNSGIWKIGVLPMAMHVKSVAVVNDEIYIVTGDTIYKLTF